MKSAPNKRGRGFSPPSLGLAGTRVAYFLWQPSHFVGAFFVASFLWHPWHFVCMASFNETASPFFSALWHAKHDCSLPAASLWWHSAQFLIRSACALCGKATAVLTF